MGILKNVHRYQGSAELYIKEPETEAEKSFRYWPNYYRGGGQAVGLFESTYILNRGCLWEDRYMRIEDALRKARVTIDDDKITLTVPGVHTVCKSMGEPYESDVFKSDSWNGHKADLSVRIYLYQSENPPTERQTYRSGTDDSYDNDFSFYDGLCMQLVRSGGKLKSLVSLFKVWFNYNQFSTYGWSVGHEFNTELVKEPDGSYRLKDIHG